MFYCDACAKAGNYRQGFFKSYGLCEICRKPAQCSDVPSSIMDIDPKPAPMEDEDGIIHG